MSSVNSTDGRKIQLLLEYLGYNVVWIDGIIGPKTNNAISLFMKDYGLSDYNNILKYLVAAVSGTLEKLDKELTDTEDFWYDIKYFIRNDFVCKCGKCDTTAVEMDKKLVSIAEKIVEHFGSNALVTSGIRCKEHNAEVGGVANSKHLTGNAMDFKIFGVSGTELNRYISSYSDIKYHYIITDEYVHMNT